jgi:hypothetical protein
MGTRSVEVEHVFPPVHEFGIHLWDAPPPELPGLQLIVRQPPSDGFLGNHFWID